MKKAFPRLALFTLLVLTPKAMAERDFKPVGVPDRPAHALTLTPLLGETFSLFLPRVVKPPLVLPFVTYRGEAIGYPTTWWVYGYVSSPVSTPVYSVTVGIDVTYYPYCEPDPCDPYARTEIVNPAFPATLPGQINPFSWSLSLGKAYATVGQVKILSASLTAPGELANYPLTILNWQRQDKAVIGRARNNSAQNLVAARVVVVSDRCAWRDATLDRTSLQPDQETDFRLDFLYCEGQDVVVIGQGVAGP